MVCENTVEASSRSLENVYAAVKVKPCEKRFSSFAATALYFELPALSRNRATVVKRGNGRSNCCCATVAFPKEEEGGICPKYGFETFFNNPEPMDRYCAGSWLMFASGMPSRVFLEPRYITSMFQFFPSVF